jgi:hypothetical protein
MGSDERLSTRDIASPSGAESDPRFDRETDATEPPPEPEAGAVAADDEPRAAEPAGAEPAGAGAPTADAVTPVPTAGRGKTLDTPDDAEPRAGAAVTEAPSEPASDQADAPLLDDSEDFQSRWEEIQVRFVDEPRGAVEDADALVATVMQRLAEGFAQERERLEAQWGRGEDISTEDLRVALQRYRSFFRRLLAT